MIEYSFGAGPVRGGGLPRPRSTTARSPDVPRPAPASGFSVIANLSIEDRPLRASPSPSLAGGMFYLARRLAWDVASLETDLVRRPRVRRGTAPLATVGMERRRRFLCLNECVRGCVMRVLSLARPRLVARPRKRMDSFTNEPPLTWLILPVVICLSQRLSHASVSTCRQMAKPRTAH